MSELFESRGATLSPCGRYRYRLWREWDAAAGTALFVLLNPSTADAQRDDPTVRRCRSFAEREGRGRLEIVNLFGWRASHPSDLDVALDPVGPVNDVHVACAAVDASLVILGWGAWGDRYPIRVASLLTELTGRDLFCLGTTITGCPRHPLYLPSDAPLLRWEKP